MTLLTDSEQVRLLEELDKLRTTTRTKIEAVFKKYGLDKVPAVVDELRRQNTEIHETAKKSNGILRTWANSIKQAAKDLRD
jgi:hypothetical protein